MAENPYNGFSYKERCDAGTPWRVLLAEGAMPLGPCDGCGTTHRVLSHAEDYGQPWGPHLGCFGVCFRCHMAIHCRYKRNGPERWKLYLESIAAGYRWAPVKGWPQFAGWWYQNADEGFLAGRHLGATPGDTELHRIESGVYREHAMARKARFEAGLEPGPALYPAAFAKRLRELTAQRGLYAQA